MTKMFGINIVVNNIWQEKIWIGRY